jgi:putative transposase
MPDYRRNRVPSGTFFFTVNLLDRRSDLLVANCATRFAGCVPAHRFASTPGPSFPIICIVCGPCRKAMPISRVAFAKIFACRRVTITSHHHRGERGIWQRRYREHTIRDDRDFAAHMDYAHFNPVKHGLVSAQRIGRIRRFVGA